MKDVSRHYDKLTPQERLALTVEALARGDTDESNRLMESCTKERYVMNNANFSLAFSRLRTFALMSMADSYRALARANLAIGTFAAGKDEMWTSYVYHMTSLLSFQEAWNQFCDSIGLDGDKMFAAFSLDVADLQRPPLDESIVANGEAVAILFDGMKEMWEFA